MVAATAAAARAAAAAADRPEVRRRCGKEEEGMVWGKESVFVCPWQTHKKDRLMGDRPPATQAKEGGATIFRSLSTYPCVRERRFPALEKRAAAVFSTLL